MSQLDKYDVRAIAEDAASDAVARFCFRFFLALAQIEDHDLSAEQSQLLGLIRAAVSQSI